MPRFTLSRHRWRVLFAVFILLNAGFILYVGMGESVEHSEGRRMNATNVTFFSTQGTSTQLEAGVYAISTDTKEVIWSYTQCPNKCFDVDPIGNDTVLFVAKTSAKKPWELNESSQYNWKAIRMNWRTGEIHTKFSIPIETHDVDYIGDGKYIIANKIRHTSAMKKWLNEAKQNRWIAQNRTEHRHLIYIYDRKKDDVVWEYRFKKHFPETAGDGPGRNADYTHLNDVDIVLNGTTILASPREFDRVVLINRSTKELEWILGEEDNHDILYEQHNPVLLSDSPPTVLVSDSENDRVVEYKKTTEGWSKTWVYRGELQWPRDADRLPNGNTLIVDSGNDRLLEVAPEKEIVWEIDTGQNPYDVERLEYGDEPRGTPIHELSNVTIPETVQVSNSGVFGFLVAKIDAYKELLGWILPVWLVERGLLPLHFLIVTVIVWIGHEGLQRVEYGFRS